VRQFLILRGLRIYPPFLFCVALAVVAKLLLFGSYPWFTLGLGLTLLPLGQIAYPLGVEWSLVYEVFFYMVIAVVSIPRSGPLLVGFLAFWTGAILLVAFFYPGGATQLQPTYGTIFFSLFNLSFIAGVVAYLTFERLRRYRLWLLLAAIVLFIGIDVTGGSTVAALICTALSFGCLVAFVAIQALDRDLRADSPLVRLGDYSYGMYLVHVPLVTMLFARVPGLSQRYPYLFFLLAVALALILGSLFGGTELSFYKRLKLIVRKRRRRD
jgi:exopolysaccharide production protein ExoZ